MKTHTLTLLSALLLVGCDGGGTGAGNESGTTSGGETDGPETGENPNPSAPDPTTPTTASDSDTDSAGESSGMAESSTGMPESGSDSSGETGDPVDPADLPFGGYMDWTVQDLFAYGVAEFYEIPDDPAYQPDSIERPLGEPVSEDNWEPIAGDTTPMPDPKPGAEPTPLDPGPQVFVDGSEGASFTFEYSKDTGTWDMGFVDFKEPYPGGDWTVDFPGNAEFPAETFENVLVGHAADEPQLEIITDANGIPTSLSWMPLDGHQAYVFAAAFGPEGQFLPLCDADLADDGEADIPPECAGQGDIMLDPNEYDTFMILFGQSFKRDVAYGDHRVRLTVNVGSQNVLSFPFEAG